MRADGILFDKDGTLFDFATTWEAWATGFLDRLTGQDRQRATVIGAAIGFDYPTRSFARDSLVIAGTPGEVVEAMLPFFDLSAAALEAVINDEAANAPQAEAVPLAPFLDGLKTQGLKLGVATNDSEAPARAHLRGAGVEGRFDFIAGYDSGFGSKPGPGMCLGFARSLALDPGRVVMVGDSLHDLHAGRAAGMQVVGVLTGMAVAEELAPHADIVLADIGHLPAWLTS